MIQIEYGALSDIFNREQQFESRKAQIAAQKQQIHQFRNQRLSMFLQQDIDADDIAQTEYGKPYLKQYPLAFNHSHSQQHYALAMSQLQQHIGIDIEDLDRQVRMPALAQHAFHADELAYWQSQNFDRHYWFKVWTIKEAVLKASGLGIRLSLNELNTQATAADSGIVQHERLGSFVYQSILLPQAMLTVAWQQNEASTSIPEIRLHALF